MRTGRAIRPSLAEPDVSPPNQRFADDMAA
jgi:hypothetical protein